MSDSRYSSVEFLAVESADRPFDRPSHPVLSMLAANSITATGELADLIRTYDWAATPLGPIDSWSESLVAVVNLMLSSPVPAALFLGQRLILLYNDAYSRFPGHPIALGQPACRVYKEAWHIVGQQFEAALRGEITYKENYLIPILQEGLLEDIYWTYSFSPVYENGRIAGVFNVCQDTTDAVIANRKLMESEETRRITAERLQLSIEAADLGTWYYDPEQKLVGGDKEMAHLFGMSALQASAETWLNAVHPDDRARVSREFGDALAGKAFDTEYRVLQGTSIRWVRAKARLLADARQPMVGICEDITARKTTEENLTLTAERLRLALAAAKGMGTFDWDIPNDRLYADPQFCAIFGLDPVLGSSGQPLAACLARIPPEDRPRVERAIEASIIEGVDYVVDYRVQSTPGSIRWVTGRGICTRDASGNPIRFPGVVLDITERKSREEALIRSEKLAAVGRLAASIAHEINNPLEAVTNLVYLARSSDDLQAVREYLETADTELRRASAVTSQTLRFHKQSTKPNEVSCEELIASVYSIHRSRIANAHVRVEKRKRAHRPVLCFESEIRQVLSNLLGNAIDAMAPGGGRLLLRSREGHDWRTGRSGLVLTIADSGSGIPPTVVTRIFEPFYTTKGIGGTGLGLWISREILDRHEGRLSVRSSQRAGHSGSVFTVFLPYTAAPRL